jgi:nitrite reductase/ring-hydroxylating ferredoxin subunit
MERGDTHPMTEDPGRRRFLARTVQTIHAAIAATLGVILGGSIVLPSFARRREDWLPAAALSDLPHNEPFAAMVRVQREDGYSRIVDRKVIFLVKTGESRVRALSSTCTHLGCRVSWDPDSLLLKCPCHGGVFDATGAVKEGPPPTPLPTLPTRIEGDRVLVRL